MAERDEVEALLRSLIERFWNEGRLDAVGEFFALDAVVHAGAVDHRGHGEIAGNFAGPFQAAFDDLRFEVLQLVIEGERAAMRIRGTGRMTRDFMGRAGQGQPLEYHGNILFRLAGGRIAEVWAMTDLGAWLAEQPPAGDGA